MTALDVYALACLAGGPVRAVDTAVVTLLLDGRLRAEENGALGTAALRYGHPVEAAVLDAVGRRALRSIGTVRFRAAADERLTGLVAELAAAGLLRRVRRPSLLRRGQPGVVPTDAGRSALREARREADDRVPLRVALNGLGALPDQDLRRRVFELPPDPHRIGGGYLDLRRAQAEMESKGLIGEGGGANGIGGGGGGP
jgi:hypothetical protein